MKKQLVIAAAVLALAGAASAQTTNIVRLTGATAYRAQVHQSITNLLNTGFVYGYSGTSFSGASQSQFIGTLKNGGQIVNIKCSWGGSVGGVRTLTQNLTVGTWLNRDANLTTAGTQDLNSGYDSAVTADIAMSDAGQGATPFPSPTLTSYKVGIIPFVWTRNVGSPNTLTNITALQAQTLLQDGKLPFSMFTGNSSDTKPVIVIGRNLDSGTRLTCFAECGYGATTMPIQYKINASGSAIATNGIVFYPAETIQGIFCDEGQSGYNSGGNVKDALNLTGSGSYTAADPEFTEGCWILGYLSTSDAANVTGNGSGAMNLNYNGVPYTLDNVKQGLYTFWSYEYLLYRSSLGGVQKIVADQIKDNVTSTTATIKLGDMSVQRGAEGARLTHN
jgi:hypothetical protein